MTFLVVDCSFAYNAVLGRPTLNSWKTVTSIYHMIIKFPTKYSVGKVRGDQVVAHKCYIAMLEIGDHLQTLSLEEQRTVAVLVEGLEEIILQTQADDQDWHPRQSTRSPSTHDLPKREPGYFCLEP